MTDHDTSPVYPRYAHTRAIRPNPATRQEASCGRARRVCTASPRSERRIPLAQPEIFDVSLVAMYATSVIRRAKAEISAAVNFGRLTISKT